MGIQLLRPIAAQDLHLHSLALRSPTNLPPISISVSWLIFQLFPTTAHENFTIRTQRLFLKSKPAPPNPSNRRVKRKKEEEKVKHFFLVRELINSLSQPK